MIETLIFTPLEGEFDVAEVERFLRTLPFTFRDPSDPDGPFLLCGTAGATQYARDKLLREPEGGYPPVALVRLAPRQIRLGQRAMEEAMAQARAVAEWIHARYPCRITDDEGGDYTSECRESVASLYEAGPQSPLRFPQAPAD